MAEIEKFQIASYTVDIPYSASVNARNIQIVSIADIHNLIWKANLTFESSKSTAAKFNGIGMGVNMFAKNFDPKILNITCPLDMFDSFYAVVSTENPLFFHFIYDKWPEEPTPQSSKKLITTFLLQSNSETPGDFEKVLSGTPK